MENEETTLPTTDFETFIQSLYYTALTHLGEAPNPEDGKTSVSLPLAKQTIDLLGLFETKTKGNLSGHEERFLIQVLYDVRLRFVERSKAVR